MRLSVHADGLSNRLRAVPSALRGLDLRHPLRVQQQLWERRRSRFGSRSRGESNRTWIRRLNSSLSLSVTATDATRRSRGMSDLSAVSFEQIIADDFCDVIRVAWLGQHTQRLRQFGRRIYACDDDD